ncbi:hypothetical protein TRM7557_01001 [Tritonibacter multivorans]|uniref:Inner membrane protein YgaP-like transmembrane domain-containing protein n=1 Tax=Tritonibacter multivorans TaxID=928856 RepID=A0A0N7LZ46_9RHOB|nr:DUF2892 domain-containing protein [Tritonibacter multivorans]MDA7421892.1 DUF2892 domain-containing protein [Tritonibacter multivorans]CUH76649.1 hypothetical protein TRM7557_01001 [Tritonibacter multivorans]SFD48595.1 Protein of unknown function [Tritonibacter multivorans]
MTTNVGTMDRILRAALGLAIGLGEGSRSDAAAFKSPHLP